MRFAAELFIGHTEIFLQSLNDRFEFFIHNNDSSRRRGRRRELVAEDGDQSLFISPPHP
jgi:hypothetical protein